MNKKLVQLTFLLCWSIFGFAQQPQYKLKQFTFEDTSGKKYNLDSLKGKVVYVDCWFPSCPPCRAEMPYSQLLQQRLHTMEMDSNIVFITISFKQSTEEWKTALHNLSMPNAVHLYSPASTYEIALSGGNYPTYRLFNTNGELDIENAAYPRELTKIDFTLFAATQKITINDAKKMFAEGGQKLLEGKMNSSKYELLNTFFKRYNPHKVAFKQAYLALSH